MSMTATTDRSVDLLNSLLQGEISAQQAHEKALALASDMTAEDVAELRRVSAEHTRSAEILRTEVFRLGGAPSGTAGPWGAFARAFQASANLLGASAALASLLEGEEHGLREYQEALEIATGPTKALLKETLIPNQREHIAALGAISARRRSV
jgi:bacterioferritin (cytochrome b1)